MPRYNKDIRHIITREEAEEMIRKAKRLRDAFIVAVLYITGARPNEILQLKKEDIWIKKKLVHIKLKTLKLGKGRRFRVEERVLQFSQKTPFIDIVLKYWQDASEGEKLLKIKDSRLRQIIYELSDNRFCPYNFRHSRLTKLARAGATIDELMYWKGSADERSVSEYLKAKPIGRRLKIE